MKTREEIIDDINNFLKEDLTEQFQHQEEITEFGDITITNSKNEQITLQMFMFNADLNYIITDYKILLQKIKEDS